MKADHAEKPHNQAEYKVIHFTKYLKDGHGFYEVMRHLRRLVRYVMENPDSEAGIHASSHYVWLIAELKALTLLAGDVPRDGCSNYELDAIELAARMRVEISTSINHTLAKDFARRLDEEEALDARRAAALTAAWTAIERASVVCSSTFEELEKRRVARKMSRAERDAAKEKAKAEAVAAEQANQARIRAMHDDPDFLLKSL